MMYRYSLIVEWSEEDQLYLVTIPEFSELVMQPSTAGKSYEEAVQKAQEAIASYLEHCKTQAITPPQPRVPSIA